MGRRGVRRAAASGSHRRSRSLSRMAAATGFSRWCSGSEIRPRSLATRADAALGQRRLGPRISVGTDARPWPAKGSSIDRSNARISRRSYGGATECSIFPGFVHDRSIGGEPHGKQRAISSRRSVGDTTRRNLSFIRARPEGTRRQRLGRRCRACRHHPSVPHDKRTNQDTGRWKRNDSIRGPERVPRCSQRQAQE